MPAPADPELTIQRAATAVVIAQGPLVARIGAVAAMSAIPTLLLAAALFALVPPIMAAGVAAATLLMDGLVAWAFVRVAMARVELRITAGEIAATSAPAPTRTVRFDTARLRRLRVERGGARVKLVPGRPSVRVAVVA
ncbi:MAG: hypothetical protein KC464_35800, partial [Myxococcales bacterium]|nr:hypothetical protein [Myxococcales bacterium]